MKRLFFGIAALALSSAALLPPQAMAQQVDLNILIGAPPPPTRYEIVPAPRHGYIWAPGYWDWNGRRHIWREGHWERARPGYVYYRPEWRQDHGQWKLYKHGWEKRKHEYKHHYKHDDHRDKHRGDHDDDRHDKHR